VCRKCDELYKVIQGQNMSKRFSKWEQPKVKHGKLTKWNWMVQNPEKLSLGENSDIGAFTYINSAFGVDIGNDVQIGSHCAIYSISTIDKKNGKVVIGSNTSIGSHSTIMPGVKIGKNCIVGAHSFVNKNIPDNFIAYGAPVKLIKERQ